MLTKFRKSAFRPSMPLLIWDGNCGFCKYWVTRWQKLTGDQVFYKPYQLVDDDINDIPRRAFKEAARLIEVDGTVYNGAHAAYQALSYSDSWSSLSRKYEKNLFFRIVSDHTYAFVASNRSFLFKITKLLWGKDPNKFRKYWLIYLISILTLIFFLVSF